MKRSKNIKLNSKGFSHLEVAVSLIVVVLVASVGVKVLSASHADSLTPSINNVNTGSPRSYINPNRPPSVQNQAYQAELANGTNGIMPPSNPSVNINPPNPNFFNSNICKTETDNDLTCNQSIIKSINSARANPSVDGIGSLALGNPATLAGYESLSVPDQLFIITNLERLDRGLIPLSGMTKQLDNVALAAADANEDPNFTDPYLAGGADVYSWESNWGADSINPLGLDFELMYNDGYKSGNIDCKTPSASGCWGHRDGILGDDSSNVFSAWPSTSQNCYIGDPQNYMGVGYDTYANANGFHGPSFTELFVGACGVLPSDIIFTWAQAESILKISGPHAWTGASSLSAGKWLNPDQSLASPNGQYRLTYQGDGNLVEYNKYDQVIWNAGSGGKGVGRTELQTDGNLVVYNQNNQAVWQSGTGGTGNGNKLEMQSNGSLVIYSQSSKALWEASTGLLT